MQKISGRIQRSSMALLVAAAFWCSAVRAQILVHFDLPAQSLARSLKAIGTATNTDVGFSASQVAGLMAPSVRADLTLDGALIRVLAGTGLRPQHLDDHTIVIAAMESSVPDSVEKKLLLLKVSATAKTDDQMTTPQSPTQSDSVEAPSSSSDRKKDLEEIVVTGTHLRGVKDSASPLQVYTRDQIDQSGLGTVAEFVQTLPQNFNGGAAEGTFYSGGGNSSNSVFASGVNLRGLGNDATLVLVDGQRIAPGNQRGNIVDISMIPLSAVERIDVVTDGASAIYGSDAVGGVVNIVLRQKLEGAETRAKYGSVSDGSSHQTEIGQSFGRNWDTGSGIVSYEFYDRTPLSAADRSYSKTAPLPFDLLPETVRQSVFAGVKQSITPSAEIFADANYSHRSTTNDASVAIPGATYLLNYPISVDSYNTTLGSRLTPFSNAQLELSANYGRSDTVNGYSFSVGASNPVVGLKIQSHTTTGSVDAKLDGTLGSLSAGPVLFAAGAQYRRETLDYLNVLSANSYKPSRNIAAAYAELRIPIVGPTNSGTSLPRVELNLAGRTERYSDFGSTTNPQVGVIWNASGDFRLRGTYGRSFKAPDLYDLNPVPTQIFPEPGSVLGGGPNTIFVNGGNPELKPERGKTWTIGIDLQPIELGGLKARLTYYDIKFSDLLVTPSDYIDQNHLFNFSSLLGPGILRLNPTSAQISNLISNPAFEQIGYNVDLSTIGAIFDTRTHNLAALTTKGLDFGASYKTEVARGHLEGGVDGTYIWKFDSQFAPAAPTASILDTPYNPLKWKLRGHMSYARGAVAFNTFINHLNGYTNNLVTPSGSVASWTTVDASLIYKIPAAIKPFRNATLTFAVINLLNRNPPFLNNAAWPINYDGANANPLGRYLSVQISLPWEF